MTTTSINFPRLVIRIDKIGDNSLIGSLCIKLQEMGLLKDIEALDPDEIVFVIKQVLDHVNIYEETNKVRDMFKIDEQKITVFMV